MALNQSLLPEFDHEMANTRKSLERIPEGKFDWKPHQKSMTLGALAGHLATLNQWAEAIFGQDSFDLASAPAAGPQPLKTRQEILDAFDKHTANARKAIAGTSDEKFMKPWSLLRSGQTIFSLPRAGVVRSFLLSHSIHHRAQLGVYLRMNDVPVPSIYGPSADEGSF